MPLQESYKEFLDASYSESEKEEILTIMLQLAELAVNQYLEGKSNGKQ